jgi:RND family efflux transporter MFP subunit
VKPLKRQNFTVTLKSRGAVQASIRTVLRAETRGRVGKISRHFRDGGSFKKGDLLIEINSDEAELDLLRQKNEKRSRSADLRALDVEISELIPQVELSRKQQQLQKQRLLRVRKLAGKGVRNKEVLGTFMLAEVNAQINLQNLVSRKKLLTARRETSVVAVDLAKIRVDQAQLELSKTRVLAPFDGRVSGQSVDLGQFVSVGAELARIIASDKLELRLPLSSREIAFVELPDDGQSGQGQKARAESTVLLHSRQGGRDYQWSGQIQRTEAAMDAQTRQLFLIVRIDQKSGAAGRPPLRPGTFVSAHIKGLEMERVYVVPRSALRGPNELFLVKDGSLRRQQVEILWKDADFVVIKSGVEEGDQLCTTPIVFGGQKIAVKVFGKGDVKGGREKRGGKRGAKAQRKKP